MGPYAKIALVLVVVAVCAAAALLLFKIPALNATAPPVSVTPPFQTLIVREGMRLYRSQIFGFDVQYPENLFIREWSEGNTSTITFEDAQNERGFQIFVVPYEGDTVSKERFMMDVPSGVITDQQEVIIDDARAILFSSQDPVLGETREVWFIKNGFLFEVTAHKALDAWLAEIMAGWRFIN